MEGNILGMLAAFVGVAILLGVGTIILGNSAQDCTTLPGYNSSGTNPFGNGTGATIVSTGWSATCDDSNTQSQSAYALLLITLIIIAAVVILAVVRMI